MQLELQWTLLPHRKHMSAGLGIRRPIVKKNTVWHKTRNETTIRTDLIIDIYRSKTNVFCQCSASRDVLLSRLLIFIVACKCAVAICINNYMLRSHPKENSIFRVWLNLTTFVEDSANA